VPTYSPARALFITASSDSGQRLAEPVNVQAADSSSPGFVHSSGHLLGVEDGDRFAILGDVSRSPVADVFEQTGEAGVDGRVLAKREVNLVAAWLKLAALAGAVFGQSECLRESFRAGGADGCSRSPSACASTPCSDAHQERPVPAQRLYSLLR
jgi:hypothetical protein